VTASSITIDLINQYRRRASILPTYDILTCVHTYPASKSGLSLFNIMPTFLLTPAFGLTSTQESEEAFVQWSDRGYNQFLFPAQDPLLTRTCILQIPSQHVGQPPHDTTRNHEEHHSTPSPNPADRLRLCLARG
jgi:hypothetical protein